MSSNIVDYSKGYPPHVRHVTFPRDQKLVASGYQDSIGDEELAYKLGRADAHKRPFFHPSIHGVPSQGSCNFSQTRGSRSE